MKTKQDLCYIDPECFAKADKELSIVSGFVAGHIYNEVCNKLVGGRWPDSQLERAAPEVYNFFMLLMGNELKKEEK